METKKDLGIVSEEKLFALLRREKGNLSNYIYTTKKPFCLHKEHFKVVHENGKYPLIDLGQGKFESYVILSNLDCSGLNISACSFKVTPAILGCVRIHKGKFYDGGVLSDLMKQGKLAEWGRPIPDAKFPAGEE